MKTYLHKRTSAKGGTVTLVAPGQPAEVHVGKDNTFDFVLPKGDKGDPLTWDDLTSEQKASLKGETGDIGTAYQEMTDEDIEVVESGGSIDESAKKKFPCGPAIKSLWDRLTAFVGRAFVPKTLKINGLPLDQDRTFIAKAEVLISVDAWLEYAAGFSRPLEVDCPAVAATDDIIVVPAPDSYSTWYNCNIRATSVADGKITFETDSSFDEDVTAYIIIIKGAVEA